MAVRPVLSLPDRRLSVPAGAVGTANVDELVRDLVDTMRASPACVGLAAPQIGVGLRAFVADVSGHPRTTTSHGLVVLMDPEIIESHGREAGREGCMSVPHLTANVVRAQRIVVRGRQPDGSARVIATDGFEARAFQHEIDHLDGSLILDRVASLSTDVFRRRRYQ
ncbi:MAG TPA: peptide deformylase [Actinomycetota bacterium]|nr:peptide deformylase [Actinomycetota bacterium]